MGPPVRNFTLCVIKRTRLSAHKVNLLSVPNITGLTLSCVDWLYNSTLSSYVALLIQKFVSKTIDVTVIIQIHEGMLTSSLSMQIHQATEKNTL